MGPYRRIVVGLTLILGASFAKPVQAQSSHSHGHGHSSGGSSHHHPNPNGGNGGTHVPPVLVNPGSGYGPILSCRPQPILVGWFPVIPYPYGYGYSYTSPGVVTTTSIPPVFPIAGQAAPIFPVIPRAARNPNPALRSHDTARAKELTELGDRLFRAGNFVRAIERYEQAIRANPDRAEPRARLAQIALVRGKYQDAANKLREALTAEPEWLATAGNLQAVFPEPAAFDRHVANLEAHLQAHPDDRDAWLVLGSLWYLSGRTQKASDVFLRLSDRREDPTLKAFLQATKSERDP